MKEKTKNHLPWTLCRLWGFLTKIQDRQLTHHCVVLAKLDSFLSLPQRTSCPFSCSDAIDVHRNSGRDFHFRTWCFIVSSSFLANSERERERETAVFSSCEYSMEMYAEREGKFCRMLSIAWLIVCWTKHQNDLLSSFSSLKFLQSFPSQSTVSVLSFSLALQSLQSRWLHDDYPCELCRRTVLRSILLWRFMSLLLLP